MAKGFASMTPERRREVAREGGKQVQRNGTAHRWSPEEAREAGKKGAESRKNGRESVEQNRRRRRRRDSTDDAVAGGKD